jgi:hypothetical protein
MVVDDPAAARADGTPCDGAMADDLECARCVLGMRDHAQVLAVSSGTRRYSILDEATPSCPTEATRPDGTTRYQHVCSGAPSYAGVLRTRYLGVRPALVAQGIEQRFPKPCVGSSILPGGTHV